MAMPSGGQICPGAQARPRGEDRSGERLPGEDCDLRLQEKMTEIAQTGEGGGKKRAQSPEVPKRREDCRKLSASGRSWCSRPGNSAQPASGAVLTIARMGMLDKIWAAIHHR